MTMKKLGLYIHIPFCKSKCDYCDFVSFCTGESEQERYLNALMREIDLVSHDFKDKVFDSIFIGGGTPSAVFDGFISRLMEKIQSSFNIDKNTEFTIEVNPNSITENKLKEYLFSQVNRISMGVQTLNDDLLSLISRKQTHEDVFRAVNLIKEAKIKNTSADVMLGLPNQSKKSIEETLNYLIKNDFKHISVYTLQVEENTPLCSKIKTGELKPIDDDTTADMYSHACEILKGAGYDRYELSNFARSGYECRHNKKYWCDCDYLGLGLSAHSYINGERIWNTSSFVDYISALNDGKLSRAGSEKITNATRRTERIMLSLRTKDGLNLEKFKHDFNEDLLSTHRAQIDKLIKLNLIEIKGNRILVKEDAFELLNSIILELID